MNKPVIGDVQIEFGGMLSGIMNDDRGDKTLAVGAGEEKKSYPKWSAFAGNNLPDIANRAPLVGAHNFIPITIWIQTYLITIPELVSPRLNCRKVFGNNSKFR